MKKLFENIHVDHEFADWVKSLTGCDGGNLQGEYYFCGIEPGTGGQESEPMLYITPTIPGYMTKSGLGIPSWTNIADTGGFRIDENRTKVRFDQKVAKLYLTIKKREHDLKSVGDFILNELSTREGDTFKFNLYPLSFKSHHDILWHEAHFKLTGLPTKALYRAYCQLVRFPIFRSLVEEYSPKAVICFGRQYARDFGMAFGGQIHGYGQLPEKIASGSKKIIHLQINNKKTQLFILPFLSGVHGVNSSQEIDDYAKIIREASL